MKQQILLVVFASSILIAGCSDPKVEACWSPETKASAQNLISASAQKMILSAVKTSWVGNKPFDEATIKQNIANNLTIKLSNFYLSSRNIESKSLECGANISASLTSMDKSKTFSVESLQQFNIHAGENGLYYTVNGVPSMLEIISAANIQ